MIMSSNGQTNGSHASYTNYVVYEDSKHAGQTRVGHLDIENSTIQLLCFVSGAPLSTLYQVGIFSLQLGAKLQHSIHPLAPLFLFPLDFLNNILRSIT